MRSFLIGLFLLFVISVLAQSNFITVQSITIQGNEQTKTSIVLRELDFKIGDTLNISEVAERFAFNEKRLEGLDLFSDVKITMQSTSNGIDISVQIEENLMWVIYPNIDFADNDINVWAQRYNYSLKRISVPITFTHLSLTGNRDQLKARIQLGFTRKIEFQYTSPFIDKQQTWRLNSDFLLSDDKEARFNTIENRDSFLRNEEQRLFKRLRLGLGANFRPDLFESHQLQLSYFNYSVEPEVAEANPNFFLNGKTKQRFFTFQYEFAVDRSNFELYPTKGYRLKLRATKEGLGIWDERNALILKINAAKYFFIHTKLSFVVGVNGETNLVREQSAYYNLSAIGSEPNLARGYELRQIRGLDYAIGKTTLRYHLGNLNINLGKLMPIEKLKSGTVQILPKIYSDWAYVNTPFFEENNHLSNQLLWGRGVGVDAIIYKLGVAQIEWSLAKLDDKVASGLFFHFDLVF